MLSQEIRNRFLQYFKKHSHTIVSASSVVPHSDPTLLFINAGMNQFKDVFLGTSSRDYKRAASSQKCIRVGGKHNDLENVGHTSRHLTFFEMLGNFSFGDYFKKEAIKFAWEISTEVFGYPPEKIWPSVFKDDHEAFELWTAYVPARQIARFGEAENFWAMGDTGPCGPCSELLFDRGEKYGSARRPEEDTGGERFLEFWNLVFMQFNRNPDGSMTPLPKPSIDTGAGLERNVALKMQVDSVFETDILRGLIAQMEGISGIRYDKNDKTAPAFHVIADHLRCLAFAIADGAQPSNVERGYVLRKILRRAVRYGRGIGMDRPFLADLLPRLIDQMGEAFPEIVSAQNRIGELLTIEEESFLKTLRRGGNILNQIISSAEQHQKTISGDDAFKVKDTYGLPIDEILLIARDADLKVDMKRYHELEEEAKERSRKVHKTTQQMASESIFDNFIASYGTTAFTGFQELRGRGKIIGIVRDGHFVPSIKTGEEGMLLLDATPFYAEMGGQVGDTGKIHAPAGNFLVQDCKAPFKGLIGHIGQVETGELKVGQSVDTHVDSLRRQRIANNHTATHLLHWALFQVIGEHVRQAGSVVDPDRLRFDFSHHKALSLQEIRKIEDLVNEKIRENRSVEAYEIPYEEAQTRQDIKQFFGDKYDSVVRVVDVDYSKELCGGVHTSQVGNIGLFRIVKESSIAAGVRRIEAVTGAEAEYFVRQTEELIDRLSQKMKTPSNKIEERTEKLVEQIEKLELQVKQHLEKDMEAVSLDLVKKREMINGIPLIVECIKIDSKDVKLLSDKILQRHPSGVIVLVICEAERCSLFVRVSQDLIQRGIKAVDLIQELGPIIGGKGGGKADIAQAGGKSSEKAEEVLTRTRQLIAERGSKLGTCEASEEKPCVHLHSEKKLSDEWTQILHNIQAMGLEPPAGLIAEFSKMAKTLDDADRKLEWFRRVIQKPSKSKEPLPNEENDKADWNKQEKDFFNW